MKKKTKSTSLAIVQSPSTYYRDRVSSSYADVNAKTGEWFRSVISFGALLDEVAAFLGEARHRDNEGEGLKSWLAENCPEVNVNTAYGYKSMATKCAKMLGGGTMAIAALQGLEVVKAPGANETVEIDAEVLEKRDQLFETVDSRRKLEQMYLDFFGDNKPKGGRPVGTKAAKVAASSLSPEQSARALWSKVIEPANIHGLRPAAALLSSSDAKTALTVLTELCDFLKRRLATLGE